MSSLFTKVIVLAGFLVAFAAGLVTGYQQQPVVATTVQVRTTPITTAPNNRGGRGPVGGRGVPRPPPPASILDRELNLDAEQRTKLEAIWKEVAMLGMREMDRRQEELRRDRDEAVVELLEEEAAEEYGKILSDYKEQVTALQNQWWEQYSKGVEQTKAILNPAQVERFEEIMRRNTWSPDRGGRGGRGGRGPGGGGRGGSEGRGGNERPGNREDGRPGRGE